MLETKNQEIFDTLSSNRKINYEYELFTDGGAEYWSLNDFLELLKSDTDIYVNPKTYKDLFTLKEVFRAHTPYRLKAGKPEKMERLFANNVHPTKNDVELSRYACWTIVKEIGQNKPSEFYQEYFIHPDCDFQTINTKAYYSATILLHKRLSNYKNQLNGIIKHFTSQRSYFADFHSNLLAWFAPYINKYELYENCHIPFNASLPDYMNPIALKRFTDAHANIITQFDNLPHEQQSYDRLYTIAHREMISANAIAYHQDNLRRDYMKFDRYPFTEIEKQRKNYEMAFAQK